jgi:hypothetical protein
MAWASVRLAARGRRRVYTSHHVGRRPIIGTSANLATSRTVSSSRRPPVPQVQTARRTMLYYSAVPEGPDGRTGCINHQHRSADAIASNCAALPYALPTSVCQGANPTAIPRPQPAAADPRSRPVSSSALAST